MDISTSSLRLKTPKKSSNYELELPLPFPVKDDLGTAKFDKSSRCLTVTLPVVPAPVSKTVQVAPEDKETADNVKQVCQEARKAKDSAMSNRSGKSPTKEAPKHNRWICNKAKGVVDPVILEAKEAASRLEPRESDEESAVIVSPDKSSEDSCSKDPEDNWILLNETEAKGSDRLSPSSSPGEAKLDSSLTTPLDTMVTRAENAKCETQRFIPAKSFDGEVQGYTFKEGSQGRGYYLSEAEASATDAKGSSERSNTQPVRDGKPTQKEEILDETEVANEVTGLRSLQLQNREMFRLD